MRAMAVPLRGEARASRHERHGCGGARAVAGLEERSCFGAFVAERCDRRAAFSDLSSRGWRRRLRSRVGRDGCDACRRGVCGARRVRRRLGVGVEAPRAHRRRDEDAPFHRYARDDVPNARELGRAARLACAARASRGGRRGDVRTSRRHRARHRTSSRRDGMDAVQPRFRIPRRARPRPSSRRSSPGDHVRKGSGQNGAGSMASMDAVGAPSKRRRRAHPRRHRRPACLRALEGCKPGVHVDRPGARRRSPRCARGPLGNPRTQAPLGTRMGDGTGHRGRSCRAARR